MVLLRDLFKKYIYFHLTKITGGTFYQHVRLHEFESLRIFCKLDILKYSFRDFTFGLKIRKKSNTLKNIMRKCKILRLSDSIFLFYDFENEEKGFFKFVWIENDFNILLKWENSILTYFLKQISNETINLGYISSN